MTAPTAPRSARAESLGPWLGEPLDMVTLGFAVAVVATVAAGRRMPAGN